MRMFDLDKVLAGATSIGIAGHVRPDGDCVGACLGLWMFIRRYYPQAGVRVYLEPFPESYAFLEGADQVSQDAQDGTVYDLFIAPDCSDCRRMGAYISYFERAGRTLCIDHHVTNGSFADENCIVADASSTCEILCDLIGMDRIDLPMAQALYLGMAHDTGVFRYSCTSRHTMELAGALMDKGIDCSRIVEETFFCKSYNQQQILGRTLLESVRVLDGRVIFGAVRQKDMEFFGVIPKDLDGIVSEMRETKGVETAIFLYETGSMEWKVSLRSTDKVDVAKIALLFGGGGHVRAAGCCMQGSMYDVVNNIVQQIYIQLRGQET